MPTSTRRRGFTFIEALFAVFLVGLSATVLTATMPVAHGSRHKADLAGKAMGLAQKQLETIRGAGYANLIPTELYSEGLIDSTTPVATDTYRSTNVDSAQLDNVAKVLPSGQSTVKVEQVELELRRITVTVTWVEKGKTRSFAVGTLVAYL